MGLSPLEQGFVGLSFSGDGEILAATTFEELAIWSTGSLERLELETSSDWGWTRLIGDSLYVSRKDASILRVDPLSSLPIGNPLIGHPGIAGNYALDEANGRLASLGGTVRVWDLETGRQLGRELPSFPINMEFTDDGTVLSVSTSDHVSLWNFDTDTRSGIACEIAGRNLTADEWDQFGPRTLERRATCPQFPLP